MQKHPEVSNRKRGWRMRRRKKGIPLDKKRGPGILSLSGSDQRLNNIVAFWCLGTTHTSLDVALVSPFHPVAAFSRSALCWHIQDPQLNYKLTLTGLWQTSKRKLNPYGSPKYQMRIHTYMKTINLFLTPLWRFRNYQRTPNRMLTRRLPDTKYINASPRIRLHASIRLE